jgi:hypothetical protein
MLSWLAGKMIARNVLRGFPWRQTICVRGHIHLDDPEDGSVHANRGRA